MTSSPWVILIFATLMVFVSVINMTNYTPLTPLILKEFQISHTEAGFLFTATFLVAGVSSVILGVLADRYGSRRLIVICLLILFISSLLSAFATNYQQFFVFRLSMGLVPALFVVSARLIADWFSGRRMGFAQGAFGGLSSGGASASALIIPFLSEYMGWRIALAISSLTLLPLIVLSALIVKDRPALDTGKRRVQDVSILKMKEPWILFFLNSASFGSFLVMSAWLPSYFHEELKIPLTFAGIISSVAFALGSIGRATGGALADKYGGRKLLVITGFFLGISYAVMAQAPGLLLSSAAALVCGWFYGFGGGPIYAIAPAISPKDTGKVMAIAGLGGIFAGLAYTPIFGYFIDESGTYFTSMMFMAMMGWASMIASLAIKVGRSRP